MDLADLDYPLPPELIAQEPAPDRSAARLLVVPRDGGALTHACIRDLPRLLRAGDLLVLNDARVIPARLRARRPSGGRLEVLLLWRAGADLEWEALVRGSPCVGERVHFPEGAGEWIACLGAGRWRLRLAIDEPMLDWLGRVGEVPLPPYIRRPDGPTPADRERYQTVYAASPGAVAAPTAGLHFTAGLLAELARAGIAHVTVTLHVGPGTFLPLRATTLEQATLDAEAYTLPPTTVTAIERTRACGRRIVAIGTTTTRALEAAASTGPIGAGPGEATLFIRPGHRFGVVDALLTNFHLPRSSLLALVAAFAGWSQVRTAYAEAVRARYRFYSFGDAMLLA